MAERRSRQFDGRAVRMLVPYYRLRKRLTGDGFGHAIMALTMRGMKSRDAVALLAREHRRLRRG